MSNIKLINRHPAGNSVPDNAYLIFQCNFTRLTTRLRMLLATAFRIIHLTRPIGKLNRNAFVINCNTALIAGGRMADNEIQMNPIIPFSPEI